MIAFSKQQSPPSKKHKSLFKVSSQIPSPMITSAKHEVIVSVVVTGSVQIGDLFPSWQTHSLHEDLIKSEGEQQSPPS